MSIFLRILMLLLIALAPVIISTSCSKDDDVEEIFMGKTFYISGATIDGKALNEEVKLLYLDLDSYYITFNDGTFAGKLDKDCTLSGHWSANGRKRTISIIIDTFENPSASQLSASLHKILSEAKSYSGDANILTIKADEQNFIRLRTTKK